MSEEYLEGNPRAGAGNESDDDGDFEAVDYRFLTPLIQKRDYTIPSRGEKDFEPDGTNKQDASLQASRDAMYAAITVERDLSGKNYIPAIWDALACLGRLSTKDTRGTMFKSIGRADNQDTTWLLPEELLYMVERGNVECFYEKPPVPMSLQAAYAELIPHIGLDQFQVYAYLKRAGYMVLRTKHIVPDRPKKNTSSWYLSFRLIDTLSRLKIILQPADSLRGPIGRKTIYRSYRDIYSRMSFVPCHLDTHKSTLKTPEQSDNLLKLSFDVWKPNTNFRKSAPGPPHFRVAVLDSRKHNVCSIEALAALFDTIAVDQEYARKPQFTRLKTGRRNFVLAVADMGVVSFLSLGDVSFGSEVVYTEYKPFTNKPRREYVRDPSRDT
ncbi:protein of unknown function [Taphrina deformans PYCC 5710]|uniref:tRNA-splicing endonuclease subunit Sen54 N-terminal domain-containing protein n=1 Tax=Taphrina deformans (strain PYCC 5710 / ATCC 11124 / CBS 356.35 / IMI 108563 / JCM 9778 / NBRC 8474) TaxID=1097556 RepID=R4XEH1_TAPDE|nr:protein of unknown function [Taphrina deformans PYCC 5710]|eukprot:CCG84062.1 protein of unknown function [Taphrina deformans PYCC 5710]